jgi:hypothetical protein
LGNKRTSDKPWLLPLLSEDLQSQGEINLSTKPQLTEAVGPSPGEV